MKTYDELIAQACEDLVGTCMDKVEDNLRYYLERDLTLVDIEAANKYMADVNIQECACCGWWQSDNGGPEGNLCWQCEEDEANDEEEYDDEDDS